MRLTKKRICLVAVVLLCAGYGIWWWAESGKVELEIGRETTYITGPLNDDGTVNYLAHINAQLSQGVTPENNAAIVLARAVGPTLFHEEVRDKAMKLIGMGPLPAEGDYFVGLANYVEGLPEKDRPALTLEQKAAAKRYKELSARMKSGGRLSLNKSLAVEMMKLRELARDVTEVASDQLEEAMRGPWSAEKLTIVAGCLKANAKSLAVVETATKSRHIYIPLLSPSNPPQVIDCLAPSLPGLMGAGKALTARAMLKLSNGDLAGAWQDLMTARRLARLISQGATIIEGLVGMRIEAEACSGCVAVIAHGKLSASELQTWATELEAMEPLRDIRENMAFERFTCLDSVMMLYREQRLTALSEGVAEVSVWWIDWNEVLRTGNHWYDRLLAPLALRDMAERHARLTEVQQDMDEMLVEASDMSVLDWVKALTPTGRRKKVTKAVTVLLLATLWPSMSKIPEMYDEGLMKSEMLQVATALALHEAETGRFPARLADLAPRYIKTIPPDRFSGKPLVYKREGKGCVVYSVGMNLKDDGGIDNRDDDGVDDDDKKDDIIVRFNR